MFIEKLLFRLKKDFKLYIICKCKLKPYGENDNNYSGIRGMQLLRSAEGASLKWGGGDWGEFYTKFKLFLRSFTRGSIVRYL